MEVNIERNDYDFKLFGAMQTLVVRKDAEQAAAGAQKQKRKSEMWTQVTVNPACMNI